MADQEKRPHSAARRRLDSVVHLNSYPKLQSLDYYGPRQMSQATKDIQKLTRALIESITLSDSLLLPEKVTLLNIQKFKDIGLSVEMGDMIYKVGIEYINATATLLDPSMAFEHLTLPKRSTSEAGKLAEYTSHHGTSGRLPYSTKDLFFNMVHGQDGDGHKALKKVEELKAFLKLQELKLASIEAPLQASEILIQDIETIKQTIQESQIEHEIHQKIVDEQTMPSAAHLRRMLQKKLSETTFELFNLSSHERVESLERKIKELSLLLECDDADLVGMRLYTGPSFGHINAIGNKVAETLRFWSPEDFSHNLLVKAIVTDTINQYSQEVIDQPFYRGESLLSGKKEEADQAAVSGDYVVKTALTSTKRGDYATGFVDSDTILTKLSGVRGLNIGELSYWQGEDELLVQPGQYKIEKVGSAEHVHKHEHEHSHHHHHHIIEYRAISFGGQREDHLVTLGNISQRTRVIVDPEEIKSLHLESLGPEEISIESEELLQPMLKLSSAAMPLFSRAVNLSAPRDTLEVEEHIHHSPAKKI